MEKERPAIRIIPGDFYESRYKGIVKSEYVRHGPGGVVIESVDRQGVLHVERYAYEDRLQLAEGF